jgi:hypothetical protein
VRWQRPYWRPAKNARAAHGLCGASEPEGCAARRLPGDGSGRGT